MTLDSLESRQLFTTFLVDNGGDSGAGTLRQAILDANASPNAGGADVINFNVSAGIPAGSAVSLQLNSALPEITDAVVIDGFSDPNAHPNTAAVGDNAARVFIIDGTTAGAGVNGLTIRGGGATTIRGLIIRNFHAFQIAGGNGITVEGQTDASVQHVIEGNAIVGNNGSGVAITGEASNVLIGGTGTAARNVIGDNDANGVELESDHNTVVNNIIGRLSDGGSTVSGNGRDGVRILGDGNVVRGNVIGGNDENGVSVFAGDLGVPHDNVVAANLIGLDATGKIVTANGGNGVAINGAAETTVGGASAADRNVISGNRANGVQVGGTDDAKANNTTIANNFIGTDITGLAAVPNAESGVSIVDHVSDTSIGLANAGNVISGNQKKGIAIIGATSEDATPTRTTVLANIIGLGVDGDTLVKNGEEGIAIFSSRFNTIGGASAAERNIISGNDGDGIDLNGTGSSRTQAITIRGNYIGTDITGTKARGNDDDGIDTSQVSLITIGGVAPGSGNVISGNRGVGLALNGDVQKFVFNSFNTVQGNIIGLDATGTKKLGNRGGIDMFDTSRNLIGGNSPEARNIVSGNGFAVSLFGKGSSQNVIQGNYIGPDINGKAGVGNGGTGVYIEDASDNLVGGSTADEGNVIAFNGFIDDLGTFGRGGVAVVAFSTLGEVALHNAVRLNSIYGNAGPAIDLNDNGTTANDPLDADTDGGNELQNAPVITSASLDASGRLVVKGLLGSTPNRGYVIDVYGNAALNIAGFSEGRTYLGSLSVVTDASGNATFTGTLDAAVAAGQVVSAVASDASTSPFVSTSEFSPSVKVTAPASPPPTISVSDVSKSEGNSGVSNISFTITRSGNLNVASSVNVETSDGTATAGSDYTTTIGLIQFAVGEASKVVTVSVHGDTTVEADETFFLNLTNPTNATLADAQGQATIVNDDATPPPVLPTLSIGDVTANEGNSGVTAFVFTVTRSGDLTVSTTVNFATADGTGNSTDYTATSGKLTFATGESIKTIAVSVKGDTNVESDNTFFVNLSGAANATLAKAVGNGLIKNDDAVANTPPPPPPPPANSGSAGTASDWCDATKTELKIVGTANSDTILVKSAGQLGKATVTINGVAKGTFNFTGIIYVDALGGSDTITIDPAITRTAFVLGGSGSDTVNGGGGNDVMLGDGGDDRLYGNDGRDIIIGGDGRDKIDGGNGDDLLLAGSTTLANSKLCDIAKEWFRTDANYAARVSHITNGGGLNGQTKLNALTADSASTPPDTLVGGGWSDLFFIDLGVNGKDKDEIADKLSGETVVNV